MVTPPYGRCTEPRRLVVQQVVGGFGQAEGEQEVKDLGAVGGEVVDAPAAIILCGFRPIAGDGGGDGIVTVEDLQIEAGILPVSVGCIQNVYRPLALSLVVALDGGVQLAGLGAGQLRGAAAVLLIVVEPAAGDGGGLDIRADIVVIIAGLTHRRIVIEGVGGLIQGVPRRTIWL